MSDASGPADLTVSLPPPVSTPLAVIEAAALSEVGLVRRANEDAVIAEHPVYLVADGMGGHDAGRRASAIVAEEMAALAKAGVIGVAGVKSAIDAARARIAEISSRNPNRAAGATMSGVVVVDEGGEPYWLVVNVGDSRTYRLADGYLEQLSVDHSEVQALMEAGRLSREQARHHPMRNVVTRALGAGAWHEADYWLVPIGEQDRILICSDGLTSEISDAEVTAILLAQPRPAQAVTALMEAALVAGGRDNISIVVVDAWDVRGGGVNSTVEQFGSFREQDTQPRPCQTQGGITK